MDSPARMQEPGMTLLPLEASGKSAGQNEIPVPGDASCPLEKCTSNSPAKGGGGGRRRRRRSAARGGTGEASLRPAAAPTFPLRSASWLSLLVALLAGCASIQPPDGGARDYTPPALQSIHRNRDGRRFRLRWDEYLSPASQLTGTGIWINPSLSFRASLRGKVLRIRLDSLPPAGTCFTLWAGAGIRDFTEGNVVPPTPLWRSCPEDTLTVVIPLLNADERHTIWGELWRGTHTYRFQTWRSHLYIGSLPAGTYRGWAWEDRDADGRWSLPEPVWLSDSIIVLDYYDSTRSAKAPEEVISFDLIYLTGLPRMRAWQRWQVDTFPPGDPRVQLPDSDHAILLFTEPVFILEGEAFPLSETALYVRTGERLRLADTAGWSSTFTVSLSDIDTQAYRAQAFWHAGANARTPFLHLRWIDSLNVPDTFWVGRKGDSLFLADACYLPGEVWLSPLSTSGEVETALISRRGDTLRLKLPARKYPLQLPGDTLIQQWRLYLSPLHRGGSVLAVEPGGELWLPAGSYLHIGIAQEAPFWRPVGLREGKPYLISPPRTEPTVSGVPASRSR